MTGLSTLQVAAGSGATYRQLDYWARIGILVPDVAEATGCGSRRRYSQDQLAEATLLRSLAALSTMGRAGDLSEFGPVIAALRAGTTGVETFWLGDGVGIAVDFDRLRSNLESVAS